MVIEWLIPPFFDSARQVAVTLGAADPDGFTRGLVLLCDCVFGLGFLSAYLVYLPWSLCRALFSLVVKHGA